MVKKKAVERSHPVNIAIDDSGDKEAWPCTGVIVATLARDQTTGEVTEVKGGLYGELSDTELLVVLHFLVEKLQGTFDDPELRSIKIVEHLLNMDEHRAVPDGRILSEGSKTSH